MRGEGQRLGTPPPGAHMQVGRQGDKLEQLHHASEENLQWEETRDPQGRPGAFKGQQLLEPQATGASMSGALGQGPGSGPFGWQCKGLHSLCPSSPPACPLLFFFVPGSFPLYRPHGVPRGRSHEGISAPAGTFQNEGLRAHSLFGSAKVVSGGNGSPLLVVAWHTTGPQGRAHRRVTRPFSWEGDAGLPGGGVFPAPELLTGLQLSAVTHLCGSITEAAGGQVTNTHTHA